MIADFFKLGLLNMKHRKIRSWLTILGIIIGIASIVALISISQGLENAIVEQFSKMGVQDIRVVPKGLRGPPTSGISVVFTKDDVETIKNVKGVDYVLGVLFQMTNVKSGNEEKLLSTIAYPTELVQQAFIDVDLGFEYGRAFTKGEKGSIILGHNIAKDAFKKEIRVKNSLEVNDKLFKVVGIFEESGTPTVDNAIILALDDARVLYNKPDEVSVMTVHMLEGTDSEKLVKDIKRKLKRARGNENFDVFTPQQILDQMSTILGVVGIVLAGIASISLLVGGIGIMNSMYTSVLERTRDIGVMKAVGATNSNILTVFLIESGLIGLVGGLAGILLGTGVAFSFGEVAKQLGFSLLLIKININLLAFALAFSFFVGVVSGTLPAVRASKLKPVDALRYE
ncbi:ABC transporter permease [Candidatus Woesearchaeota archaeon]|nr:ABC transporter permease [Candidatus Woesearchaeota archaeon]